MSDAESEPPVRMTQTNRPAATENATAQDWLGSNQDPDVLLSVPDLGVDKITLGVKDLVADVTLETRVLDLLHLRVGAHVTLGTVELDIENVRAQAMLKVRLDKVAEIVERVMTTIDNNPEIIANVVTGIGRGLEGATYELGEEIGALVPGPAGAAPEVETARHVEYGPGQVHTVLLDGRWWNTTEGSHTATGPFATEEEALKEAGSAARFRRTNPVSAADSTVREEPTRAAAERAVDPST